MEMCTFVPTRDCWIASIKNPFKVDKAELTNQMEPYGNQNKGALLGLCLEPRIGELGASPLLCVSLLIFLSFLLLLFTFSWLWQV